jgi:hypothetical protein
MATGKHRPGDIVHWVVARTAGEAHVVGYDAKDERVLVVAMGSQFTELDVENCSPKAAAAIGTRRS